MKFLDYIFATRPMLLLPVWTVYLIARHWHYQKSGLAIDLTDLYLLAGLTLVFAGAYYLNQVHDFKTDMINKKGGFLQHGLISRWQMTMAFVITSLLGISLGAMVSVAAVVLLAVIIVLGYLYSASPYRLKDRPIGGLLVNMAANGFLVAFSVTTRLSWHEQVSFQLWLPLYFALTVGGTYLLTTLPDQAGDKQTGKKTLVVWLVSLTSMKLGRLLTIQLAHLLMLGSIYSARQIDSWPLAILSLVTLVMITLNIFVSSEQLLLATIKLPLLLLTLLAGWYAPGYFLFVVALFIVTRIYYRHRFKMKYPRLT